MTLDATSSAAIAFSSTYRVRFDEAGPDGSLRASGLLRYAQDLAWQHSEARGLDRAWYASRGLTWLVRAAELAVLMPIPMGTTIGATTQIVGQRRVYARRRGEFALPDGGLAGWVQTDWVLIDGRGSLVRIPDVFAESFVMPTITEAIIRVPLPEPPADAASRTFAVRPHELDPMNHANNAVYVDWLDEAAARTATGAIVRGSPRRYRLEYAAAAEPGAELVDTIWPVATGLAYRLATSGGPELLRATVDEPETVR
jgi:acyl-ACP thioesterase